MVDALSGHTAAGHTLGNDGLRDGDSLSSPTLTNMLQGLKGNGILRMQDTVMSAASRNDVANNPGYVAKASANTLTITGGYVTLEGQLYEFGGGPGGTSTVTIGTHGSGTALAASGEQSMYVVYVASQGGSGRVYADGGTPVKTSTGLYPSLPSQYLSNYDTGTTRKNQNVVVLATVRCEYNSGGGSHKVNVIEINDKRTYLRSNPLYMFPITSGALGADSGSTSSQVVRVGNTGVQTAAELRALFAAPESGDVGTNANTSSTLIDAGVLWMSTSKSGSSLGFGPGDGEDRGGRTMKDELFFAGQENSELNLVSKRLFSKGVSAPSSALNDASYTITSYGDQSFIFNVNAGQAVTLSPEKSGSNYLFPEGHTIEVFVTNTGNGKVIFDPTGLNNSVIGTSPSGTRRKFVYDGSAWLALPYSTGGVTSFLALDDVDPSSFSGQAGKGVRVNSGANGLEFYTPLAALAGIDDQTSSNDDQLTIKDTEIVINDDSDASVDFRAESDNQTHMLFVDSDTDRLGVQQSTPETTMQMKSVAYEYNSTTASSFSTSSATTLDLYDLLKFRAAEVTVEIANVTDKKYEVAKILITTPFTVATFTGNTQSSNALASVTPMDDLTQGMSITGTGIPSNTTITNVGSGTLTISNAATTTATGVALTAKSVPVNATEIPLSVYSVTQSDSTTGNTGTAQANYACKVNTNKARLELTATSDSNGDKVHIKAYWRAIAI